MARDDGGSVQGLQAASTAVVRLSPGGEAVVVATSDAEQLPLGLLIDLDSADVSSVRLASPPGEPELRLIQVDSATAARTDPGAKLALIIDDERSNRVYYQAVFEQMGWGVITAADGASGIGSFESNEPAITIVDVRLPDINGYQVVRQLRTAGRRPAVMVLMSADPAMVDPHRASAAGADVALVAPLSISQLRTLLARRLPRSDPQTAGAAARTSRFRLGLVGSARLFDGGRWLELPQGPVREALAVLAAVHPAPMRSDELSYAVASASGEVDALSSLLDWLTQYDCADLIVGIGRDVRLAMPTDRIDTLAFERAATQLSATPMSDAQFIAVAQSLLDEVSAEPYPEIAVPLVDAARARILEAKASLEEALAIRLMLTGAVAESILLLRRLTALEPWREGSWGLLMIALCRQGRQGEALDLYDHIRTVLIKTVGVDPGPVLRRTEQMIRTQDERLFAAEYLRSL